MENTLQGWYVDLFSTKGVGGACQFKLSHVKSIELGSIPLRAQLGYSTMSSHSAAVDTPPWGPREL